MTPCPASARKPAWPNLARSRPAATAMVAATTVKDWLAEHKVPGRVRYYGCPAEEGGAAKAFMVRDGAFDDADIAITWHPSSFWEVVVTPSLANTRADFIF